MALTRLVLNNIRNVAAAEMQLAPRFNLLYGANGSGKTTLLEAIYLLLLKRSFRTPHISRVIRKEQEHLAIFANLTDDNDIGIEKRGNARLVSKFNGETGIAGADIAKQLPLQLINTEGMSLLDGGPKIRRQFLDWGVFHVEPTFFNHWKRYSLALTQRNALLKQKAPKEDCIYWDKILAEHAEAIHSNREQYLQDFLSVFQQLVRQTLAFKVDISYSPGWDVDAGLLSVLDTNYGRDFAIGHTHHGPHRADLKIYQEGVPVHLCLSRGQLKALMYTLKISQGKHLFTSTNKQCLFLLDDVAAELDARHVNNTFATFNEIEAQVIVTAIQKQQLPLVPRQQNNALFHVEQGGFSPVAFEN